MAEAPELPEARDPFEKAIALTIAILAVVLAFVDNTGNNGQADAIVKTTLASNEWSYYQAKSIKGNLASSNASLLSMLTTADPVASKAKIEELTKDAARYEGEKEEIKNKAKQYEAEAAVGQAIDDRCDIAALLLQIGVVVCSIAILVHWRLIFFAGLLVGIAGIAVGVTAFTM